MKTHCRTHFVRPRYTMHFSGGRKSVTLLVGRKHGKQCTVRMGMVSDCSASRISTWHLGPPIRQWFPWFICAIFSHVFVPRITCCTLCIWWDDLVDALRRQSTRVLMLLCVTYKGYCDLLSETLCRSQSVTKNVRNVSCMEGVCGRNIDYCTPNLCLPRVVIANGN